MTQTSREIVRRALTFDHPERLPRQIWFLPWAQLHHPTELQEFREKYPDDFASPQDVYAPSTRAEGSPYDIGRSVDDWGCVFENACAGIIGEVKDPILSSLEDAKDFVPPYERLDFDWSAAREKVNRFCESEDRFVMAGMCPRPWERYQFLRGTTEAFMDFADPDEDVLALLGKIHEFHLKELEFWISTDVDSIMFIDDWGTQKALLISPVTWREYFKPLYRDYCDLIRSSGKFAFMHSDGHIQAVYGDLVEIGVHALNSQLFVMDIEELGRLHRGRITFWGEMDRQHVLPHEDPEVAREAVRRVASSLYDPSGGIIVQFEISPGARYPNAHAVMEEWDRIHAEGGVGEVGVFSGPSSRK